MTGFHRMMKDAANAGKRPVAASTHEVTRFSDGGYEVRVDLHRMPSGNADADVMLWVIAAFQELTRLRAKSGEQ